MRAKPLGHNAFAAERAGVPEDDHAVTVKVLVEGNTVARAVEKLGQCALAALERSVSKVLSLECNQIESAQHGSVVAEPVTKIIEYRQAALIDHDGLAVDQAAFDRKAFDRGHDLRISGREIVAVARIEPHPIAVAPGQDPEAIVLDLVNPAGAGRRFFSRTGKAGLQCRFAQGHEEKASAARYIGPSASFARPAERGRRCAFPARASPHQAAGASAWAGSAGRRADI